MEKLVATRKRFTSMRIDLETHRRLKTLAQADHRTLGGFLAALVNKVYASAVESGAIAEPTRKGKAS